MSINKEIQLGLCCENITLKKLRTPILCSKTMMAKTVKTKGVDFVKQHVLKNIDGLIKMIEWNEQNGIKVFRISSNLFPHISNTNKDMPKYTIDFAREQLKIAGDLAKKYNQRLTFHPGQYNVIGTPNEKAFEKTIIDLDYHANVIDALGCDKNSVMVIHGGGVYGDKEKTIERWCERYNEKLPEHIKRRLVLENCEKSYSIEDCLKISTKTGVPVVFDTHHFECYKILHPEEKFKEPEYYMPLILETWKKRGIKPKFHVSEQGSGKCGHHSDYIEVLPNYLLEIPKKYGVSIDIMIEAKKKELSIFKLYDKYPFLNLKK